MANRIQIPISFSYEVNYYVATTPSGPASQQVAMMLPAAGSTITVTNRVTNQPAIVYSASTGSTTISPVVTDAGGNVPGYLPEGSYTLAAAASGSFAGASVNWEAVYGAGVGNVASAAVDTAQLTAQVAAQLRSPVGSIIQYAGSADPVDSDGVTRWLIADGRSLSTTGTYAGLYAVIGNTFGSGSGTFNLPDMRGRVPVGPDTGATTGAANRLHAQTISGVVNGNALGGTGGTDSETLSTNEMPNHNHGQSNGTTSGSATTGISINGAPTNLSLNDGGHSHTINMANNVGQFNNGGQFSTRGLGSSSTDHVTSGVSLSDPWHGHGITDGGHTHQLTAAGGGAAHNNTQPYLVVNHIIRVL